MNTLNLFGFKSPLLFNRKYLYKSNKGLLISLLYITLSILLFVFIVLHSKDSQILSVSRFKSHKLDIESIIMITSTSNSTDFLLKHINIYLFSLLNSKNNDYKHDLNTDIINITTKKCTYNDKEGVCLDLNASLININEGNYSFIRLVLKYNNINKENITLNFLTSNKNEKNEERFKVQLQKKIKLIPKIRKEIEIEIMNSICNVEDLSEDEDLLFMTNDKDNKEDKDNDNDNRNLTIDNNTLSNNRLNQYNITNVNTIKANKFSILSYIQESYPIENYSELEIDFKFNGQTEVLETKFSNMYNIIYLLCILSGGLSLLYIIFKLLGEFINKIEFEKEMIKTLFKFNIIVSKTSNFSQIIKKTSSFERTTVEILKKINKQSEVICSNDSADDDKDRKNQILKYNNKGIYKKYTQKNNKSKQNINQTYSNKLNKENNLYDEPNYRFVNLNNSQFASKQIKNNKENKLFQENYSSDEIYNNLNVKNNKSNSKFYMNKTEEGIYIINESKSDNNNNNKLKEDKYNKDKSYSNTNLKIKDNIKNKYKILLEMYLKEFDILTYFKMRHEIEILKYILFDNDQLNILKYIKTDKKQVNLILNRDHLMNNKIKPLDISDSLIDYDKLCLPSLISSLNKLNKEENKSSINDKLLLLYKKTVKISFI